MGVLTAGHCCHGQVARNMKVRVGSYHLYAEDEGQTDIAVSTIHLHPDYDAWTLDHDLCILALAHKADTSRPTIGRPPEGGGGGGLPGGVSPGVRRCGHHGHRALRR